LGLFFLKKKKIIIIHAWNNSGFLGIAWKIVFWLWLAIIGEHIWTN